ncbi:TPA: diguanylate cyclase [Klebsiella aerogenes]|nr:diguanylate cyclase [Klebsiella aerogenes]HBY1605890.1 diguanylate cyclase [Klebsiella aerogenes]HBY1644011.1 diguanylate cyclase [Klebsiella aerogenes]
MEKMATKMCNRSCQEGKSMNTRFNFNKPLNIIYAGVLCGLIIVSVIICLSQWDDITESYNKINRKHTRNVAMVMNSMLSDHESALRESVRMVERHDAGDFENNAHIKSFMMTQLRVIPRVLSIVNTDMNGHYYRVPDEIKQKRNDAFLPRERPWFITGADATDKVHFTEPYDDYATGQKIVSLSLPVIKHDSTISGVVAFDIDLDASEQLFKNIIPPVTGQTFVLSPKGVVIFDSNGADNAEIIKDIKSHTLGKSGFFFLEKNQSYYYYESINDPKWMVFYKVEKRTLSTLAFAESKKVGYGLVFSLIILFFSWWGVRTLLGNIYIRIASDIRGEGSLTESRTAAEVLADEIKNTSTKIVNITEQSFTDSLTGLKNRRAFDQQVKAYAYQDNAYIAMVDIDDFKSVNDNYGHAFGDVVLRTVAETGVINQTDDIKIYRYGGEELAVIFSATNAFSAREYLERWLHSLGLRNFRETELKVTFSAGLYPFSGISAEDAINNADQLLYEAKKQGKNRVLMPV